MRHEVPPNLSLRHIANDDHAFLLDLHNDPVVRRNMHDHRTVTMEQHLQWWKRVQNDPNDERMMFCDGPTRLGLAKFIRIDRDHQNCMLGADIHRDHRGKGLAKHVWALMLDRCFTVYKPVLHRVALTTVDYNVIGQRVYRGVGFREEGRQVQVFYRDGEFHDVICMYMLRNDWVSDESVCRNDGAR